MFPGGSFGGVEDKGPSPSGGDEEVSREEYDDKSNVLEDELEEEGVESDSMAQRFRAYGEGFIPMRASL